MAFLTGAAGALGGVGLGAALIEVGVDTTALTAGLEKAKGEVAASTSTMSNSAKAVGTGFVIAGAAAAVAMGKAVSATTEWASEVRSLVRVTGQAPEQASALASAAAALGIGVDQLNTGFGLLSKNIVNGTAGFTKYGIEVTDAAGATLPFDDILTNVIDKFQTLPAGPEQAAFAMNVFGRSGKAMIPILAKGTDGLAELEARAKSMGLVMSQEDVDAAKQLSIAHNELGEAMKGLEISIGKELIPLFTTFAHGVTDLVVAFNAIPGPVKAGVLLFVALTGGMFLAQKAIALTAAAWGPLIAAMGIGAAEEEVAAAGAVQLTLALETEAAAAEAAGVGFAAMLGPIGLVVAALGAAYLVSQHLNGAISEAIDPMVQMAQAAKLAREEHIPFADALQQVKDKEAEAAAAADGLATSDQILADKADKAAEAMKREHDAMQSLIPNSVSLADATKQLAQDHKALANAQQHGNTTGARYNALVLQTAQDTQDLRQTVRDLQHAQDDSTTSNAQLADKLIRAAGGYDTVSNAAQRYIEKLVGVKHGIDALHDKTVTVTVVERHVGGVGGRT